MMFVYDATFLPQSHRTCFHYQQNYLILAFRNPLTTLITADKIKAAIPPTTTHLSNCFADVSNTLPINAMDSWVMRFGVLMITIKTTVAISSAAVVIIAIFFVCRPRINLQRASPISSATTTMTIGQKLCKISWFKNGVTNSRPDPLSRQIPTRLFALKYRLAQIAVHNRLPNISTFGIAFSLGI